MMAVNLELMIFIKQFRLFIADFCQPAEVTRFCLHALCIDDNRLFFQLTKKGHCPSRLRFFSLIMLKF